MQALILAAGMGKRLGKYTQHHTKCMVEVGGETLLYRTCNSLKEAGINKLILVVGFEAQKLVNYVNENITGLDIEFVYNVDYAKTNNIYSLLLAKDKLAEDDTILIESDLIFDKSLIKEVYEDKYTDCAVVAPYEQWMDGTVVLADNYKNIVEFIDKKDFEISLSRSYYKTVNIYKFSKEFLVNQYIPFLETYVRTYGKNQYYETVLKIIAHIRKSKIKAHIISNKDWYEVDDVQDYDIANTIFAKKEDMLNSYMKRYGGYWRFPRVNDFCYLVNPYFPSVAMREKMKDFYDILLSQYPSGMYVQRIIAGKMFGIDDDYIIPGNGAAELINLLGQSIFGKMLVFNPGFNEYIRCFKNCEFVKINSKDKDFKISLNDILNELDNVDNVVLVNPDNPSGFCLNEDDVYNLIDVCHNKNKICIIDESFIDFADAGVKFALIKQDILEKYENLIVIKSISKTYGVPGLRLGVLATSNKKIISEISEKISIWNINSFAEYFMQVIGLYKSDYIWGCNCIVKERKRFTYALEGISYLKVYPSEANFIMCKVNGKYNSSTLAKRLIADYNILIKDLSDKNGFYGESFIRLAVKDKACNDSIISALVELDIT